VDDTRFVKAAQDSSEASRDPKELLEREGPASLVHRGRKRRPPRFHDDGHVAVPVTLQTVDSDDSRDGLKSLEHAVFTANGGDPVGVGVQAGNCLDRYVLAVGQPDGMLYNSGARSRNCSVDPIAGDVHRIAPVPPAAR
jgi:hypothetical protein